MTFKENIRLNSYSGIKFVRCSISSIYYKIILTIAKKYSIFTIAINNISQTKCKGS